MRKYFLSYSTITKDYYLDYGCFDRDRVNLGKVEGEKLIKKLKEEIKIHKKTLIYGEVTLDYDLKELLSKEFKDTCIKMQFVKNLESLC